ncbi:MAG: hypothetical protein ACXWHB_17725 [Usitatibacter sp.]
MEKREPLGFQVVIVTRTRGGATRSTPSGQVYTVRSSAERLAELLNKSGTEAFVMDVYAK